MYSHIAVMPQIARTARTAFFMTALFLVGCSQYRADDMIAQPPYEIVASRPARVVTIEFMASDGRWHSARIDE